MHTEFGNKWSEIARHLIGKNNNDVKNHFYTIFRKYLRKIIKHDLVLPTALEVIKCHYIVVLLIKYFTQSIPNEKKDYLKTLIVSEGVTLKQVFLYMKELNEKHPTLTRHEFAKYLYELDDLPIDFNETMTS